MDKILSRTVVAFPRGKLFQRILAYFKFKENDVVLFHLLGGYLTSFSIL
jgi:hypothetical protein